MKEHKLEDMECTSETETLTTKADGTETTCPGCKMALFLNANPEASK